MSDVETNVSDDATNQPEADRSVDLGNNSTQDVPADDAGKQADAPDGDGNPVTYEAFNLPEGVTIADEDLEVFTEIGQEYGLPQEGAQRLVDLALQVQEAAISQMEAQLDEQSVAEQTGWQEELQADKELGGENLQQTEDNVRAFANSPFVTDGLHELFESKGLYRHPEVARLFNQLGGLLQEDAPSIEGDRPTDGKSPAQRMFANSTAN